MAEIDDFFGKASIDNNYAVATTVKTIRASGETVLEAYDLSRFADDTPVFVITYKKTTDPVTGIVSVTGLVSWKALVNTGANTLTNLTLAPGYADDGNDEGDFIECIPTSYWENSLVDGILVSHNPDGTLKDNAVTANVIEDGAVTTDAIEDGAVTLAKLPAGATELYFNSASPNSLIPNDYTTYGTCTVVTTGGKVRLMANCQIQDGTSGAPRSGHIRLRADGTTVPDTDLVWGTPSSGAFAPPLMTMGEVSLPAGTHTFIFQVQADTPSASNLLKWQFSAVEVR